jgi:hypothetical protein
MRCRQRCHYIAQVPRVRRLGSGVCAVVKPTDRGQLGLLRKT